jgi:tRNA1Val (adenine37-N6)-methyltransferase
MGNVKDLIIPAFKTPEQMAVKHTHASIVLGILSQMDSKTTKVVELGSGNGVVLVLMAKLNPHVENFIGIEINEKYCEVAREVVKLNNLSERVKIIHGDIQEASNLLTYEWADCVVFNPPFHNDGKKSQNNERFLERNVDIFDEFVSSARDILKYGHKFFAVTSPKNMVIDFETLTAKQMILKKIVPIYGKRGVDSKLLFLEGKKGGKKGGFKMKAPVFLSEL